MKIRTAAKVNLALDVTGILPNGYHDLKSVFQTVGLYDEVTVELTAPGSGITITCDVPEIFMNSDPIPCDERNIACKAAKRLFDEHGIDSSCRIHIKKGIPSQAGMGGGSTDAAAVLYCLEKLTGKKLSAPEKLGADVPFFLTGGTAYIEGIGEKITPIADYSGRILVIGKGAEGVSTADAYRAVDALDAPKHPDAEKLAEAIKTAPDGAYRWFGNLFEDAVKLNEVDDIKSIMAEYGALNPCMTGSGSAVFGLFTKEDTAASCAEKLRCCGYFAEVCQTVSESFTIIE